MKQRMKAVICTRYGPPEMLKVMEVPKPKIKDNQILVKIMAAPVNSGDVRVRSLNVGRYPKFLVKVILGFNKPRKPILGTVFSGVVEAVGKNVSKFTVGAKVFGSTNFKFGTHAEYIAVDQDSVVIEMPQNASFEEAASIVFGGNTALCFLNKADILDWPNKRILIIGGTGSVGSAAIQLAKLYTLDITVVCSSEGEKLVSALGIRQIILYDKEDITNRKEKFDFIFDAVGKTTKRKCKNLLSENGVYRNVHFGIVSESVKQLKFLRELFEKGLYKAVIHRIYPLNEIVDAHSLVETGRKKGNVILKFAE
jgi:NADPH:quinone reductase-like Zn-dependent oxidoreductase